MRRVFIMFTIIVMGWIFFLPFNTIASNMQYGNEQYGFTIAFPEGWNLFQKNGAKFIVGAKNEFRDKIIVTVDQLSLKHRGRHKDISRIPGYLEYTKNIITKGLGGYITDSGITNLSNNPAIWIKFAFVNKSRNAKNYIIAYQIQTLRNDLVYTVMARASDRAREEAFMAFAKLWPALKKSIFSFSLKPAGISDTTEQH